MTIKIEAWQKRGKVCNKCIDVFEFCCWQDLAEWLKGYSKLNACDECSKKELKESDDRIHVKRLIKIVNKQMQREIELLQRLPFKELSDEEQQKVILFEIEKDMG